MTNWNPHVYAFFIALVSVVGVIILAALKIAVPDALTTVMFSALAGGLGLAVPSVTKSAPPAA